MDLSLSLARFMEIQVTVIAVWVLRDVPGTDTQRHDLGQSRAKKPTSILIGFLGRRVRFAPVSLSKLIDLPTARYLPPPKPGGGWKPRPPGGWNPGGG